MRALVQDAGYVLCEHGFLRHGWCYECPDRRPHRSMVDLAVIVYMVLVLVLGYIAMATLGPATLITLASALSLLIVLLIGWIVVTKEVTLETRPPRR